MNANLAILMENDHCHIIDQLPPKLLSKLKVILSIPKATDGSFYIEQERTAFLTRNSEDIHKSKSNIDEWHQRLRHTPQPNRKDYH